MIACSAPAAGGQGSSVIYTEGPGEATVFPDGSGSDFEGTLHGHLQSSVDSATPVLVDGSTAERVLTPDQAGDGSGEAVEAVNGDSNAVSDVRPDEIDGSPELHIDWLRASGALCSPVTVKDSVFKGLSLPVDPPDMHDSMPPHVTQVSTSLAQVVQNDCPLYDSPMCTWSAIGHIPAKLSSATFETPKQLHLDSVASQLGSADQFLFQKVSGQDQPHLVRQSSFDPAFQRQTSHESLLIRHASWSHGQEGEGLQSSSPATPENTSWHGSSLFGPPTPWLQGLQPADAFLSDTSSWNQEFPSTPVSSTPPRPPPRRSSSVPHASSSTPPLYPSFPPRCGGPPTPAAHESVSSVLGARGRVSHPPSPSDVNLGSPLMQQGALSQPPTGLLRRAGSGSCMLDQKRDGDASGRQSLFSDPVSAPFPPYVAGENVALSHQHSWEASPHSAPLSSLLNQRFQGSGGGLDGLLAGQPWQQGAHPDGDGRLGRQGSASSFLMEGSGGFHQNDAQQIHSLQYGGQPSAFENSNLPMFEGTGGMEGGGMLSPERLFSAPPPHGVMLGNGNSTLSSPADPGMQGQGVGLQQGRSNSVPMPAHMVPDGMDEMYGDEDGQELSWLTNVPTRHLWVGNLLTKLHRNSVKAVFEQYAAVEDIVTFPGRQYAFVNFHSVDDAVRAMHALENREVPELTAGRKLLLKFRPSKKALGRVSDGPTHGLYDPMLPGRLMRSASHGFSPIPGLPYNLQASRSLPFDSLGLIGSLDGKCSRSSRSGEWEGANVPSTRIWLGNIAAGVTTKALRGLLSQFGPLVDAAVFPQRIGALGYAFVNFERIEDAKCAFDRLNNQVVVQLTGNKQLKMRYKPAKEYDDVRAGMASGLPDESGGSCGPDSLVGLNVRSRNLWMGNLMQKPTKQAIEEVFSQFGMLDSVRVFPGKTYAFVNFVELRDAEQAYQALDGVPVPQLSGMKPLILRYQNSDGDRKWTSSIGSNYDDSEVLLGVPTGSMSPGSAGEDQLPALNLSNRLNPNNAHYDHQLAMRYKRMSKVEKEALWAQDRAQQEKLRQLSPSLLSNALSPQLLSELSGSGVGSALMQRLAALSSIQGGVPPGQLQPVANNGDTLQLLNALNQLSVQQQQQPPLPELFQAEMLLQQAQQQQATAALASLASSGLSHGQLHGLISLLSSNPQGMASDGGNVAGLPGGVLSSANFLLPKGSDLGERVDSGSWASLSQTGVLSRAASGSMFLQ